MPLHLDEHCTGCKHVGRGFGKEVWSAQAPEAGFGLRVVQVCDIAALVHIRHNGLVFLAWPFVAELHPSHSLL